MTHPTEAMIEAGFKAAGTRRYWLDEERLKAIYLAMQSARPTDEGEDWSRATMLCNIEEIVRRYRDIHPHSLASKIMAAIPRYQAIGSTSTPADVEGLRAEIASLKAEMERRDENERRHCLNYGPCSRMGARDE